MCYTAIFYQVNSAHSSSNPHQSERHDFRVDPDLLASQKPIDLGLYATYSKHVKTSFRMEKNKLPKPAKCFQNTMHSDQYH